MPRVAFTLKSYAIKKEDDGWFGNGVDLYTCWIISTASTRSGGAGETHSSLKKGLHEFNEQLFVADIPLNTSGYFDINLYESDDSTSRVKTSYRKARVPSLENYAVFIEDAPDEAAMMLILNPIVSLMKALEYGLNSDDFYGSWIISVSMLNDYAQIKIIDDHRANCELRSDRILNIPYDGGERIVARLAYHDTENDIEMTLAATVIQ